MKEQLNQITKLSKSDPQEAMATLSHSCKDRLAFMNSEITNHVDQKKTAIDGLNKDIRHDLLKGTDKELHRDKALRSKIKPLKHWIHTSTTKPRNISAKDVRGMVNSTRRARMKKDIKRNISKTVSHKGNLSRSASANLKRNVKSESIKKTGLNKHLSKKQVMHVKQNHGLQR